jgi:hypothetical protein
MTGFTHSPRPGFKSQGGGCGRTGYEAAAATWSGRWTAAACGGSSPYGSSVGGSSGSTMRTVLPAAPDEASGPLLATEQASAASMVPSARRAEAAWRRGW